MVESVGVDTTAALVDLVCKPFENGIIIRVVDTEHEGKLLGDSNKIGNLFFVAKLVFVPPHDVT